MMASSPAHSRAKAERCCKSASRFSAVARQFIESRESLGGIQSGSIEFELEFSKVNGDQVVEAPANPRPLSALTESLGGTPGLDGVVGGAGGGSLPAEPQSGDGTTPEAQDFKEYADCLDKARPEDTEALQDCAHLLERP